MPFRTPPAVLRAGCAVALLGGAMSLAGSPAHAAGSLPRAGSGEARKVCVIGDPLVDESSGLAASRRHPGIVYTINDSGGTPRIFALGPDCRVRAILTLGGAHNRDWEAIAIGRDGLYVGDIGDNRNGAWPYVTVYRIPEPTVLRTRTLTATAYRIKYADGPRNAETMLIDPRTNRLYLASKAFGGSLYAGPKTLSTAGVNVVRRVGDAPLYATDGAFAPDGRTFVIRGYWDAQIYSAPGRELAGVSIPQQKQGEGVTYSADGRSLLFGSEGTRQPLWQVPVPREAQPSPAPGTRRKAAPASRPSKGLPVRMRTVGLLIAAGLVVAAVALFARRRAS